MPEDELFLAIRSLREESVPRVLSDDLLRGEKFFIGNFGTKILFRLSWTCELIIIAAFFSESLRLLVLGR